MVRGIIVVVVGEEPLVIHVDADDIPQQIERLASNFRLAHNPRTQVFTLPPYGNYTTT